ncbi:uroporphyrinogen decarboxylase family protein [Desulfosarcina sp.]|uniref:uroporphyrinogen decarboxylase family protein n=1 Tax=Desulfosarcina sp. TaxID=2027861 RepID=UPI003566BF99
MSIEMETGPITSEAVNQIAVGAQSNDHSAQLAGVSTHRFFTDAVTFVRVQLLVTEFYNLDVLSNFWDVYNIEAEAMGQTVVYHPGGIPDTDRTRPLIGTPSDLDRLSPPDPYRSGRMPWVLEINRNYLEMAGTLERVYFTAPFSLAVNIRGYENLVADMFERPRFAHRLFQFLCDDVLSPYLETMREAADIPDLLMDGRDAWASPPMISLDMMDEYVVAYTERLRRNLGGNLITRGNWGDAKSRDPERFFSQKCRCSPGSLSVLDPDLFEVGPERVKRYARQHDLSVAAGVDATLLKDGPVEAIVQRIKRYIDKMARDGRCMIHLNQIAAETPPEHVHAAVAACHTFGRLPIPENIDDVQFNIASRPSFSEFVREKMGTAGI